MYGASAGERMQGVEEQEAVFSAGESDEDIIALINHVPFGDGLADFAA